MSENRIQELVKVAYEKLPNGGKKLAAELLGKSRVQFDAIVRGDVQDLEKYPPALEAIKQAALQIQKEVNKNVKAIEEIAEEIK